MPAQLKKTMTEKRSPRGLVPTSSVGCTDIPYNTYLSELDPKHNENVQYALAAATDGRFREFLRLLSEPQCRHYALATIAKKCDISLPEWGDFWRKAQTQRALAIATNAIPALTIDMTIDAQSRTVVCERCDGLGEVEHGEGKFRPCPNCEGKGTTRKVGDMHSREKLLEMSGLINKKGSAAVVINQNFGGMGVDSASDRLSRITFDVTAEDAD